MHLIASDGVWWLRIASQVLYPRGIQTQKITVRAQHVSAYVLRARKPPPPAAPTAAPATAPAAAPAAAPAGTGAASSRAAASETAPAPAAAAAAASDAPTALERSPLPMLEELACVTLHIVVPLRKVDGAKQGLPLMRLEIPDLRGTVHVGLQVISHRLPSSPTTSHHLPPPPTISRHLSPPPTISPDLALARRLQPEDFRTVLGLWFDNFSRSYTPPADPARLALPRECNGMVVALELEQTILWLHPSEAAPAFMRVELNDIRLDVAKTLRMITHVSLEVGAVGVHGRWQVHPQQPLKPSTDLPLTFHGPSADLPLAFHWPSTGLLL